MSQGGGFPQANVGWADRCKTGAGAQLANPYTQLGLWRYGTAGSIAYITRKFCGQALGYNRATAAKRRSR